MVVVEFSDFQCPFCARFTQETMPEIDKTYLQTGKAQMAFMNFPLPQIHQFAMKAAEVAECAGRQGKFWQMHDSLFQNQKSLDQQGLLKRADVIGLNRATFGACMAGETTKKVSQDAAMATSLGLQSTPSFLVGSIQPDGRMKVSTIISGAQPFATFKAAIEEAIASNANRTRGLAR